MIRADVHAARLTLDCDAIDNHLAGLAATVDDLAALLADDDIATRDAFRPALSSLTAATRRCAVLAASLSRLKTTITEGLV